MRVADTQPPSITLNGAASVSYAFGDAYEELGATATDLLDGTVGVTITGSVSSEPLLESSCRRLFFVEYTATDAAGNAADSVTRQVLYEDKSPPTIQLLPPGSGPTVNVPSGVRFVDDPGALATDVPEGELTVESVQDLSINGDMTYRYTATDRCGLTTVATRKVTFVPFTAPPVHLRGRIDVAEALSALPAIENLSESVAGRLGGGLYTYAFPLTLRAAADANGTLNLVSRPRRDMSRFTASRTTARDSTSRGSIIEIAVWQSSNTTLGWLSGETVAMVLKNVAASFNLVVLASGAADSDFTLPADTDPGESDESGSKSASGGATLAGVAAAVVVVALVVVSVCLLQRRRHRRRLAVAATLGGGSAAATSNPVSLSKAAVLEDMFALDRRRVRLSTGLGRFANGPVYDAVLLAAGRGEQACCALLLETNSERQMFESEVGLLRQLGPHPHILTALACCPQDTAPVAVLELAAFGNLRDFLRSLRTASAGSNNKNNRSSSDTDTDATLLPRVAQLTAWAHEAVLGVAHVAAHSIVHNNLAARSLLLAGDGRVRVSDFGYACSVGQTPLRTSPLPSRWRAPEANSATSSNTLVDAPDTHNAVTMRRNTLATDVWALGVAVWEIFALGGTPYGSCRDDAAVASAILKRRRPARPARCSEDVYGLLVQCWRTAPAARISTAVLAESLGELSADIAGNNSRKCNAKGSVLEPITDADQRDGALQPALGEDRVAGVTTAWMATNPCATTGGHGWAVMETAVDHRYEALPGTTTDYGTVDGPAVPAADSGLAFYEIPAGEQPAGTRREAAYGNRGKPASHYYAGLEGEHAQYHTPTATVTTHVHAVEYTTPTEAAGAAAQTHHYEYSAAVLGQSLQPGSETAAARLPQRPARRVLPQQDAYTRALHVRLPPAASGEHPPQSGRAEDVTRGTQA